ncbi:hypothetical protein V8V91_17895 [Algoriphagus halophilus]|uniref:hypothetical protein n=1 Tax=Algoriphagus halophilus TaxID=226505 RepID=UPI00358E44C0
MKKTLTILSIASAMIFGTIGTVEAQKRKVRYADEQMDLIDFQHAVEVYQEAYAKKPNYETAKKTAQAYEVLRDYDNTFDWWKTTVGRIRGGDTG